jgi:predicted RNase H-like nuclease (RuvC/YqgF family)
MGLISDLAVLVGNGVTVDTIKEIVALEKGGAKYEGNDTEQKDKQELEDKPDDKGTETPPEGDKTEPTGNADTELKAELEAVKKELAESKAQIASMQEENKHRNRDDGSIKSTQDLLNDIMIDMY